MKDKGLRSDLVLSSPAELGAIKVSFCIYITGMIAHTTEKLRLQEAIPHHGCPQFMYVF